MSRPANQVFSFPDYTSQFSLNQPPAPRVQSTPFQFNTAGGPTGTGAGGTNYVPETTGGSGGYSFGDWAKGIGGAAQLYGGFQQQDLQKQQLDFSKDSFNTNLANQAQLINNEMEARQRARLETSGKYGRDTAGQASLQSDLQSYLQPRQVSGKAI